MRDLHEIPKLRDSLSYLYIEHAVLNKKQNAVEALKPEGRVMIPVTNLSVLMLGPGTNITHAAVKTLAQNGCSILWLGEDATRFYAQGIGETRKAYQLLRQAHLADHIEKRTQVVRNMYQYRFDETLDPGLTIKQIQGKEGARVRDAYARFSKLYGIPWHGRKYDRRNWGGGDPINRAISAGNALLNGLCHAAIVSGGYSPAIGFIHNGKQLSFVYDVADLYKAEFSLPAAFKAVARGDASVEKRTRELCRQKFKEGKLLQRILPDIDSLLDISNNIPESVGDIDEDGALPERWWNEESES